ncbi:threonine aldolase family protein [Streptococcus cuniculipharyngis]|uniref:Aminotransferase class V-fold PLP-dependent enzyme n=1 Tax=Streptococcus cuniculipharyngis TaxID=1562651 RepID=A0A5C5SE56_9STRE|nr:aminotransferase class I/II-fold pyridoxal phosphate-dependent enzyme [Streptococcus cuniculipharyngis]TWS98218.1 aminotransferase class V-fold PLP-dependent enzyme [Streptococcus cuniculipharyngis]
MLHFENDYNEGVHPELLQALIETNEENLAGYGLDFYCQRASEKIKEATACPDAQVSFLAGGTQTNQVVIASLLKTYEGVLAVETGHIAVHEAGAIEFTGHKVLTLPSHEGKMKATDLASYLADFYGDGNHNHMVFPGMVYISHPTEYGTLYSKQELTDLAEICREHELPLFLDGARLGYGLAAKETDVDLETIAELTDVFYIGGTKMGALAGEAVVFTKGNMPKQFTTIVKHHGALAAKGRLFGVQFDRFFTDDLYLKIGRQAIDLAEQLKAILREKGYRFYLDSPTNQQFVIVLNDKLADLAQNVAYSFWEKYDDNHTVIRLATSWSTTQADIDGLRAVL